MLRLQIMANFAHSLSECIPATLAVLIKAETLFDLAALLHCAAALQLNIWVQRVRFKPSLVPASRLWTIICVAPKAIVCLAEDLGAARRLHWILWLNTPVFST